MLTHEHRLLILNYDLLKVQAFVSEPGSSRMTRISAVVVQTLSECRMPKPSAIKAARANTGSSANNRFIVTPPQQQASRPPTHGCHTPSGVSVRGEQCESHSPRLHYCYHNRLSKNKHIAVGGLTASKFQRESSQSRGSERGLSSPSLRGTVEIVNQFCVLFEKPKVQN